MASGSSWRCCWEREWVMRIDRHMPTVYGFTHSRTQLTRLVVWPESAPRSRAVWPHDTTAAGGLSYKLRKNVWSVGLNFPPIRHCIIGTFYTSLVLLLETMNLIRNNILPQQIAEPPTAYCSTIRIPPPCTVTTVYVRCTVYNKCHRPAFDQCRSFVSASEKLGVWFI